MSNAPFWPSCLEAFQRELTPQQFNTWIRPLRLEASDDGLVLIAPNRFVLQWVKERFASRIEELATVAMGRPPRIALVVAEGPTERPGVSAARPAAPSVVAETRRGEQASLN
ncbi:MAG TPA: DnaA N-terminal domain-containing protein, partial [Casimicrobiaceae bacterium]|nr:DnaA N-terminal domain-containing protein [Casimicrobiaceae bacterium]